MTLRASTYSRKSTEQSVTEDARSSTRQRELARAFAEARGWEVVAEFTDEAVSGTDFSEKRDGLARMLAAAQ